MVSQKNSLKRKLKIGAIALGLAYATYSFAGMSRLYHLDLQQDRIRSEKIATARLGAMHGNKEFSKERSQNTSDLYQKEINTLKGNPLLKLLPKYHNNWLYNLKRH